MEADLLRYPSDIFELKDDQWEEMAQLSGWGKKSCTNLRESINRVASGGVSLGRFLYALGIRHVGKHSAELVASSYGTVENFFKEVDDAAAQNDAGVMDEDEQKLDFPALQTKLGVGPVMIDSLVAFSRSPETVEAARNLSKVLTVLPQETETGDSGSSSSEDESERPWKGLRVVFTGSIEGMSRSEAQKLAKQLGAKSTPGSVSKSTHLVVFGEKGGKKLDQARSLGLNTMSSKEFIEFVDRNGRL